MKLLIFGWRGTHWDRSRSYLKDFPSEEYSQAWRDYCYTAERWKYAQLALADSADDYVVLFDSREKTPPRYRTDWC